MTDLPSMEWLKSFEAAGRHQNFTAAGQEVGLTQASISQHIRALESKLGVRLFRRLPRGVELTVDGEAYLNHISNALSLVRRGTSDLFGQANRTKIVLVAPASVAALWVAPRLKDFSKQYPHVEIAISAIHRQVDYDVVQSDYEIRFGTGNWAGRDGIQLYQERLVPVCAPQILRKDTPWWELPVIALTGVRDGWREWAASTRKAPLNSPILRFDSFITALSAAQAGAGILLASYPLIENLINQKELILLDDHPYIMAAGSWLTWPQSHLTPSVHDDLIAALR